MEKRQASSLNMMLLAAAVLIVFSFLAGGASGYNEAPMLTELVKQNKLPPASERLPGKPVVVKPVEKPGAYGGTWRRAYTGISDLVGARRLLYDPLVRWSPDYAIVPNLAHKWEVDDEARVFTFHLVPGVKWSDGQPFTADDILFYFEDILFDKEISPSIPRWLAPSGKAPKVTKIDDYTIRFEFDEPYSLFLEHLASPDGMELVTKPKHYLKRFHKKYANPEELEAMMQKRKVSSWVKLFHDVSGLKNMLFMSTEAPSICAWVPEIPAPAKRFVLVRNPYYWKVDTAGNQLPYIDRIVHDLQAEAQTILLKAIAGEIDMQGRKLGGMQNSVLLLAHKGQGHYKLVPKTSTSSVGLLLAPNLNHTDAPMREILSEPRFRKALSHAINRQEINKIIYRGKGTPRQAAPLPVSQPHSPPPEKAYLEYDPAKAKALLDEMGLKVGTDGKRLRSDGKPLRITLDVIVDVQSWVDMAEIIASNLGQLGIDTEVKSESRELFRQRVQTAAHDIALWSGDGGVECLLEPRWYFPFSTESLNAPMYAQWYQSGGAKGEEPPSEIKELMTTYNRILATASEEKKKELFGKIIAANEKNLWVIGLVHPPADFYVVSTKMYNVPEKDFDSWIYPNPGPIRPEQFFLTQ